MNSKKFSYLSQTFCFIIGLLCFLAPFAFWLKRQQLILLSPSILAHYPLLYWVDGVLSALCASLVLALLWCVPVVSCFRFNKLKLFLLYEILSWAPLHLVWAGISLQHCLVAVALLKGFGLVLFRPKFKWVIPNWKEHCCVLFFIVFVQIAFNQFISPLNWDNPLATTLRAESAYSGFAHTTHKAAYAVSKRFDFSQFQRGQWGSFPFSLAGNSYVIPALSLIFDLPVIDVESYQHVLLKLLFLFCVVGSYCFYLFLRLALQLSLETSSIGGILYLLANTEFGMGLTRYFPLYTLPFCLLPLALLLMYRAFSRKSLGWALCSGACLALSYYFYQSHPDAMNYAFATWFILSLFLGVREKASIRNLVSYLFGGSVVYVSILLVFLLPVFEAFFNREARVLGHQEPDLFFYGLKGGFEMMVVNKLRSFSSVLPFSLLGYALLFRTTRSSETKSRDAACFAGLLFVFLLFFIGGKEGPLSWFLQQIHLKALVFHTTVRVFLYYSLLLLIVVLYGIDFFFRFAGRIVNLSKFLALVSVSVSGALFWRWFSTLNGLFPYACIFAVLFSVFLTLKNRKVWLNVAVSAGIALLLAHESQLTFTSAKYDGNPGNCKPYVLLKTLIMKAALFPEDHVATAKLFQWRLQEYERESGVRLVATEKDVFKTASLWTDKVDSYYLAESHCRFPPQFESSRDIEVTGPVHNAMLLFEGMGSPFQWISARSDSLIGIGEGLYAENLDINPDPSFLVLYPALNALYVEPAPYMEEVGVRLTRLYYLYGVRQPVRRLLNIAGIDLLTLNESDYEAWKKEGELEALPHSLPASLGIRILAVRDLRSYGMAYIAKTIHYLSPSLNDFENFMPPFKGRSWEYQEHYVQRVNELQSLLFKLKGKHEIYLEEEQKAGLSTKGGVSNGVEIENISGTKAVFRSHCESKPCQLVFNHAALSGWRGFVESTHLKIQRANFAFLSAELPLGDHLIWFELRSKGAMLGFYLSFGALLACMLWLFHGALIRV